jgi:hypothetical protein
MVEWLPNPDCNYKNNYVAIFDAMYGKKTYKHEGEEHPVTPQIINSWYRELILTDLYFILQFVMEIPPTIDYPEFGITKWPFCNSPWVVERCKEVEDGPEGWCMDLWARGHFKSTIKTLARTIQRMAKYPNRCTMIASHTRPAAKKFLRSIMQYVEKSEILKFAFPDVFWKDARSQAPKWSEDDGIVVQRSSVGRVEATVEAWGLKEGMPIGVHFDWILVDDLETKDDVKNPDVIMQVRDATDLTEDLLTGGGSIDITGTPYSHEGVYIPFIKDKARADGKPAFHFRKHPATDDGMMTGNSVFLPQKVLDDIRARKGQYSFLCQQIINPTPIGVRKLDGNMLKDISPDDIPNNLVKFLVVDPAGDAINDEGDAWAPMVFGVLPYMASPEEASVYILDAVISPMRAEEAPLEIARMFRRNGMIMQVGIEKTAASLVANYVSNILAQEHHIYLSEERKTLVMLKPGGREKRSRIENAIAYPLYNGLMKISTGIPSVYRDRIRAELDKFPYWHDDALDSMAYLYDMIKDFHFEWQEEEYEDNVREIGRGRSKITGY